MNNAGDTLLAKKHVIGSHQAGLFSDFIAVLNHLNHCQQTDKIPVVYWDKNSLYYTQQGFNGSYNAWEYYFDQVSSQSYDPENDVIHGLTGYGKEYGEFCWVDWSNQTRQKAYNLISKYIRVKPHIQRKVDMFYQENMLSKHTIGIHLRGTDKIIEQETVPIELIIARALAHAHASTQFLIASDEQQLLEKAKCLLQGYKVISYDCYRSDNGEPLHYNTDELRLAQGGEDVLVEVLLLAQCDLLVHTYSNVSTAVLYFNPLLKNAILYQPRQHTHSVQ